MEDQSGRAGPSCPQCGTQAGAGDRFCRVCGATLEQAPPRSAAPAEPEEPSRPSPERGRQYEIHKTWPMKVGGIVLVLSGLGGIVLVTSGLWSIVLLYALHANVLGFLVALVEAVVGVYLLIEGFRSTAQRPAA